MRVVWNELTPNDRYLVRTVRPLSFAEMGYLAHLYLPLIGTASHSLYQLLAHEVDERSGAVAEGTHYGLMRMLSLPLDRLLAARERLEAMSLLDVRRRENREGDSFLEYLVKPPLSPSQFFRDEMWSVMLLNQVGKAKYELIRARYADRLGSSLEREYPYEETLTKRFYEVYHSLSPSEVEVRRGSETEQFLVQMEAKYPPAPLETDYVPSTSPALDLSFIRLHLPTNVDPADVLTTENIEFFYKLIHFYQLSSWLLGQELRDWSLYDAHGCLERETLRKRYREKYADGRLHRDLSLAALPDDLIAPGKLPAPGSPVFVRVCRRLSPLSLLEAATGGRISRAYLERAESLLFDDGLPAEVVNALLLHALRETDMELPKAYLETVRDNWRAKQIATVDEAVRAILERAEAKQQAAERAKPAKASAAGASRRSGRPILEDKLPASVQRQLAREQEAAAAKKADAAAPEAKPQEKTVMDDPELRAKLEALRKLQRGGD